MNTAIAAYLLRVALLVYVADGPAGPTPATCLSVVVCAPGEQSCDVRVARATCAYGTPEQRDAGPRPRAPGPTLHECLYATVGLEPEGDVADVLGCSPDATTAVIDTLED